MVALDGYRYGRRAGHDAQLLDVLDGESVDVVAKLSGKVEKGRSSAAGQIRCLTLAGLALFGRSAEPSEHLRVSEDCRVCLCSVACKSSSWSVEGVKKAVTVDEVTDRRRGRR